jgi:general secretion pathway protein J
MITRTKTECLCPLPRSGNPVGRYTHVGYPIKSHAGRGFTLLELLVALLIFAVLAVMSYGGLQVVLDEQDRTEQQSAKLAELQTCFAILGRDIEQIIDRDIRDNYGEDRGAVLGDGFTLEFTRTGWRNPGGFTRSHLQRVAYVVDEDHLVRQRWLVLDRAQNSTPVENNLLDNVKTLEVRFLDQQQNWQSQWPPQTIGTNTVAGLPRAVEVVVDVDGWGRIRRLFSVVAGFPTPVTATTTQGS